MKPYQKITIEECNEPLIAIPETEFVLETPPPYVKLGADYQGKSPYYLRKGVLDRLFLAKAKLAEIKPQWKIKIFDAYRPISVQQFMVDYTFKSICDDRHLSINNLTPEEKASIYEEVYTIWAIPSDNPLTPPPHSTGGAIDLTLTSTDGDTIDMGGDIDELSPRSQPDYYLHSSNPLEQKYHHHRQILLQVMTDAGFLRHQGEWWHFSYGDQMWAWLGKKKIAFYGRVEN